MYKGHYHDSYGYGEDGYGYGYGYGKDLPSGYEGYSGYSGSEYGYDVESLPCATIWQVDGRINFSATLNGKAHSYQGHLYGALYWEKDAVDCDAAEKHGLPVFEGYDVTISLDKVRA